MGQPLEAHIRRLQDLYWSNADPEGRAFVPLADAFRKAGDFQEAGRILRDGLKRHPSLASGHLVAAWTALDHGHVEAAEDAFGRTLAIDPRNIAALRGLSEILLGRRELGPALDLLERLMHEDPLDGELPGTIEALRETLRGLDGADLPRDAETASRPVAVWEDPQEAARELDWDSAALQPDRAREEEGEGRTEVAVGSAPVAPGGVGDRLSHAEMDLREDTLVTPTLGEIYFRQGLLDWAEGVYEVLVDRDPENTFLRARLEEIKGRRRGGAGRLPEESQEAASGEEEVGRAAAAEVLAPDTVMPIESLAPDAAVSIESLAPDALVSIESLAPDAAVSIESLAPDVVMPIESLAPDALVSIESLAPDAVMPIESLAPDAVMPIESLAPDAAVSIESLAPDALVSIESLAPDTVVPIGSLAPDTVVPIGSLAPDVPGNGGSDEDKPSSAVESPQ